MFNRIGSNFIAPDASGDMNAAANVPRPKSDDYLTPYKTKYLCAREDARYFTIASDPAFWNSPAHGVVAMSEENFRSLTENGQNNDVHTVYTAAKAQADAVNLAAYNAALGHRPSTQTITVPPAVNKYQM